MLARLCWIICTDEKLDETEEILDSGAVSRRDMATQMSPESGFHSSPRGKSPFSPTHQPLPSNIVETEGDNSAKLEIRDVEVDKRATVIRWSKRRTSNVNKKGLPHVEDLNKNAEEAQASSWNIAESEMNISKYVFFKSYLAPIASVEHNPSVVGLNL